MQILNGKQRGFRRIFRQFNEISYFPLGFQTGSQVYSVTDYEGSKKVPE